MSEAAFDASAHLNQMVQLLLTLLQPVFWGALCIGFVLAGAHFLTMLATRWGEKRVSGKALLFSLGVHLSMGCGVVAMIPEYRGRLLQFLDSTVLPPLEIQTFHDTSPQTTRELRLGNTPLWEQLPETRLEDLTRFDRTRELVELDQGPLPRPEFVEFAQRSEKEIAILPDRAVELPEQQTAAEEGIQEQAVVPLNTETPEPFAREEVASPVERRRSELTEASPAEESTVDKPRLGGVDRVRPDFAPEPDLASLEALRQETAPLQEREEDLDIRHREGPAPAALDVDDVGQPEAAPLAATSSPSGTSDPLRSRTRLPKTEEESAPVRQPLDAVPRTPRPDQDRELAALNGGLRDPVLPPTLPDIKRQNFAPLRRSDLIRVPATYQLRSVEERKLATRQFGGTRESEQAVEQALKWLASVQHPDGYWDASRFGAGTAKESRAEHERPNVGGDADTGVTALAVLAFLGAGHTAENGEYAATVRSALQWLISQQDRTGYLGGNASFIAGMYCHGMSAFALAEAHAMMVEAGNADWLRRPIVLAVDYIVANQTPDGSWRYVQRDNTYGDMSMFGWQLMALKSAETGGVEVPTTTKQQMVKFLNEMSRGRSGGLAGYRRLDREVTPTMTAEALFCKQMLGLQRSHASSEEAIRYLLEKLPSRAAMNYYYWYYGTLAMFQYGGEPWQRWNEQMRDLLISEQTQRGEFAGSWEPRDEWGPYGGRIYSTAVATLCLEVYYRYLPLYKSGGQYEAAPAAER
ncbi:MAG: hypothetical protein KF861_20270 [Planctomycetaceae bacterium]|nr:hypothetical protein [Planctomycetaceae bacterium]